MTHDPAEDYLVEPLGEHDRAVFSSGNQALDRYFHNIAGQDVRKRSTTVFVARHRESSEIGGYYGLATSSIELSKLPSEFIRQLPRYPQVPAVLLGRLAVDLRHRGRGLGEFLLFDALRRILQTSKEVAVAAVVVDAKDAVAEAFYRKYGFVPVEGNRLALLIATVEQMFR